MASDITYLGSGLFQVTDGVHGTDTFSNIQVVTDGEYLIVGPGAYATVQDALSAAHNGDTIVIGEGTIPSLSDLNFGTLDQNQITIAAANDSIIDLGAGAVLEVNGTDPKSIDFTGADGTLVLDTPAGFSGTVEGLAAGDTIDFANIGTVTSAVFNGTTLDVNGTSINIVGLSASSSDFYFTSDGAKGTDFVVAAAPAVAITTPVAGDNIVNASEAAAGFTLQGTASDSSIDVDGQTVTVDIFNSSNALVYSFSEKVTAGAWSLVVPGSDHLSDGTYTVTADLNGWAVDSLTEKAQTFTVDETAPTAVGTVTALSQDTGASSTDFITDVASQTVSGTYTGTLGTGETIQVSADGGTTWVTATVNTSNHTWSASGVTLSSGAGTLSVQTIDTAGNTTAGTGHAYTLDTTAPTAVGTVTALSPDTGTSSTDFITDVASQTVSGTYTNTLGTGETIQVSANGGTTWVTAIVNTTNHTWSASGVTLSSGAGTLSVQTIDTAGNTTAGTGHAYTLDTTAPTAVGTVTALSQDTGTSNTDFITDVASQTVSGTYTGTLGTGETIQVSANGGTTWVTATVNTSQPHLVGERRDAVERHRHAVSADDRHGWQHHGRHRPRLHPRHHGADGGGYGHRDQSPTPARRASISSPTLRRRR